MNVPDEAVRAGFIELYERAHVEGVGISDVRRVLEAAAPFIAAQAWDEGARAQFVDDPFATLPSNPYRNGQ